MKIYLGSDHGGFKYKNAILNYLRANNYDCVDLGTYVEESCDYPIYARKVANAVKKSKDKACGILICGTGIGMSIAANKVKGIRASVCTDIFTAKATREHNDSNILCLGERVLTDENLMLDIVKTWLETPFSGEERHIRRINMIEDNNVWIKIKNWIQRN